MGRYAQSRYSLRLWDVAKEFVLCDNFFQGAFGGSFLNHQYLISATAPVYPNAAASVAKAQIATLQSDDPIDTRLKPLEKSPASAMTGPPQFGPSALTPDGYAVNTLAPPYWPTWIRDPQNPDYSKPDLPNVLVPQTHEHIWRQAVEKKRRLGLVRRSLASDAGSVQGFGRYSENPEFPIPPPAVQLLQKTGPREPCRARQAPARWGIGR